MHCALVFPTAKWGNSYICICALSIRRYRSVSTKLSKALFLTHNSQFSCFPLILSTPQLSFPLLTRLCSSKKQTTAHFPLKLCRVSHSPRPYSSFPRSTRRGNMSCTIATCIEPENWVKILFYFPISLPRPYSFSFSNQQFSVHIHKLFSWLEKAFLVAFSISITNCVSFARVFSVSLRLLLPRQHPL